MKTILITGHDTNIGKTYITQFIAGHLAAQEKQVQVIKPVETGINKIGEHGDVTTILENLNPKYVSGFTLNSFKAPLAPLAAASLEGKTLSLQSILQKINDLPRTNWRLIETAGGLAVPLDTSGTDGRDLAASLNVDFIVLVIQNRLGAINQARLLEAYTSIDSAHIGFWLNDTHTRDPLVTASNLSALKSMRTPLWAHQGYKQLRPDFCNTPFLNF